jgi:hypothetical protein
MVGAGTVGEPLAANLAWFSKNISPETPPAINATHMIEIKLCTP